MTYQIENLHAKADGRGEWHIGGILDTINFGWSKNRGMKLHAIEQKGMAQAFSARHLRRQFLFSSELARGLY